MPVEVFYNILSYISIISVLLPIIKFFIIKIRTDAIRLLFALLCVSFAADIANEIYLKLGYRGAEIVNIYFPLQFILVSFIFALLCEKMKDLIYTLSIAFTMFFIINCLFWQPFSMFQSNAAVLQDVIIIVYTFVYFYFVLKELEIGHLLRYSSFWIVTSLFLYSLLSVYIFALANYVFVFLPEKYAMLLWTFHDLSNILKNIMFFLAMVYTKRRTPPAIRIKRKTGVYQ